MTERNIFFLGALGGFSPRGRPAYSPLVLFLHTFYDLTKQKNCSKYVPSLDLLFRLPKSAQGVPKPKM